MHGARATWVRWLIPAFTLTIPIAAQQPASTDRQPIRARADYVQVDVAVTDAHGQFVRTLQKSDFDVLEDGKRVTVASATLIDIPPRSKAAAAPARDVATNASNEAGRTYFIVIDDLHIAPEMSARARRVAAEFVDRNVAAGDLAMVVLTSGRGGGKQRLTGRTDLLKAAIQTFVGSKLESPTMMTSSGGVPTAATPGEGTGGDYQRVSSARTTFAALKAVVAAAEPLRGQRKTLVFISEGMDFDLNALKTPPDLRKGIAEVIDAANSATVSVYSLYPRGLSAGGENATQLTDTSASQTGLQDEARWAFEGLQTLAEGTGGRAFMRATDLTDALTAIDEESRSYYLLTYAAPTPDDRKRHTIDVRVAVPDLRLRARKGYTRASGPAARVRVPIDGLSDELQLALADPRPQTGVPITAAAAVFRRGVDCSVASLIHVAGSGLAFTPVADKMRAVVDAAVLALDADNRSRNGDHASAQMDLSPENYARAARDGIMIPLRIALPPGSYQLRFAVQNGPNGSVGSAPLDIDVPACSGSAPGFSSVVLAARGEAGPPFVRQDADVDRLLGQHPTVERQFARDQTIAAAVEQYGDRKDPPAIVAEVRGPNGEAARTLNARVTGAQGGPALCLVEIAPGDLPAGEYTLQFAQGSAAARVVSAPVQFAVR